jgi:hypothetical protein
MKRVTCCVCSIEFAIGDTHYTQRVSDGEVFYCPNGHALVFDENKIAGLTAKIKELEQRVDQAERDLAWWHDEYYPHTSEAIKRLTAERTTARRRTAGYKGKWVQVRNQLAELRAELDRAEDVDRFGDMGGDNG